MEKYNLEEIANEICEKARLSGDEYWEDEYLYFFSNIKDNDDFELDGKMFYIENEDEWEAFKLCTNVSRLFEREDGKFFQLDTYISDPHSYHDTYPKYLTEVEVEETVVKKYVVKQK